MTATSTRFAQRMAAARKDAGMTVNELAEACGVNRATLDRVENLHGGVRLETAVLLARALPGMGGLDWLLDEDGAP